MQLNTVNSGQGKFFKFCLLHINASFQKCQLNIVSRLEHMLIPLVTSEISLCITLLNITKVTLLLLLHYAPFTVYNPLKNKNPSIRFSVLCTNDENSQGNQSEEIMRQQKICLLKLCVYIHTICGNQDINIHIIAQKLKDVKTQQKRTNLSILRNTTKFPLKYRSL